MSQNMKQKHFIDIHKGATAPIVLFLMYFYNQWENQTAWTYLALHGTYGMLWVLKSRIFPDKTWEQPSSIWYGLYMWFGLTLYWVSPWIITSGYFNDNVAVEVPVWYSSMCVSMYSLGVFIHFAADMQKHTALKLKPNRLIDDGMFRHCRNINYFGELLIYLGFSLLAMHWIPIACLAAMMIVVWFPNMKRKDRSLSRYPEFESYRKRSCLFIPYLY